MEHCFKFWPMRRQWCFWVCARKRLKHCNSWHWGSPMCSSGPPVRVNPVFCQLMVRNSPRQHSCSGQSSRAQYWPVLAIFLGRCFSTMWAKEHPSVSWSLLSLLGGHWDSVTHPTFLSPMLFQRLGAQFTGPQSKPLWRGYSIYLKIIPCLPPFWNFLSCFSFISLSLSPHLVM